MCDDVGIDFHYGKFIISIVLATKRVKDFSPSQ